MKKNLKKKKRRICWPTAAAKMKREKLQHSHSDKT